MMVLVPFNNLFQSLLHPYISEHNNRYTPLSPFFIGLLGHGIYISLCRWQDAGEDLDEFPPQSVGTYTKNQNTHTPKPVIPNTTWAPPTKVQGTGVEGKLGIAPTRRGDRSFGGRCPGPRTGVWRKLDRPVRPTTTTTTKKIYDIC